MYICIYVYMYMCIYIYMVDLWSNVLGKAPTQSYHTSDKDLTLKTYSPETQPPKTLNPRTLNPKCSEAR